MAEAIKLREKNDNRIPYPKGSLHTSHGMHKRIEEIKGVVAVLSSLYLALSLFSYDKWEKSLFTFSKTPAGNYGGIAGAYISDAVISLVGLSGYLIPVLLVIYGIRRILGKERNVAHVLGTAIFLPSLSMLFHLISKTIPLIIDPPGGLAGLLLANLFEGLLSSIGAYILSIALVLVS
ncbi:MAG: DNA translocase FtsK 4TM domain-containing protein, partial [Nitrospirae bacterium]|nr:DNA translocase FtsK 4TM domain-containing protein [Nitrospirota bacterium]